MAKTYMKLDGNLIPVSVDTVGTTETGGGSGYVPYEEDKKINIVSWDKLVDDNGDAIFGFDIVGELFLPKNPFDTIDRQIANNVTSYQMVMKFYNQGFLKITNMILKWDVDTWGNVVEFYRGWIREDGFFMIDLTTLMNSVTLTPEMLDPSFGENVYVFPYSETTIDYIPAITRMYYENSTDDYGYIANARDIHSGRADFTKSIGMGWSEGPMTGKVSIMTSIVELQDEVNRFKTESVLRGKKIAFLGDSITFGDRYTSALATLTGCNVLNYGISGAHIVKRNANDDSSCDVRYSTMDDDADMVVLFAGTNDWGHTSTAAWGEFNDGTDATKLTFHAGLHRLFKGLYLKYLNKPIVMITPLHRMGNGAEAEFAINSNGTILANTNETTGKTLKEYVDTIKEIAAAYSITVLDAYSSSLLTPLPEGTYTTTYFQDSLHLSEAGGLRLAKWLKPQLEVAFEQFTQTV